MNVIVITAQEHCKHSIKGYLLLAFHTYYNPFLGISDFKITNACCLCTPLSPAVPEYIQAYYHDTQKEAGWKLGRAGTAQDSGPWRDRNPGQGHCTKC